MSTRTAEPKTPPADFWLHYRVASGQRVRLAEHDPTDTAGFRREAEAAALQRQIVERLANHQDRLYAGSRYSLLIIFQALDAAGKDGTIKHVMTGVNPMGCAVHSFKSPSAEELQHDFLWRCTQRLPARGMIGIFNRSYYEEALAVRVHPKFLEGQHLPAWSPPGEQLWEQRFEHIRNFERYLYDQGTLVLKFFLNVSRGEQKRRFLARINDASKNWKLSPADINERSYWDRYQAAFEDVLSETSRPWAPWYIVPADNKWFMRLTVGHAIESVLDSLQLSYPAVSEVDRANLQAVKSRLQKEH